jgi:hypothetical protein
MNSEHPFSQVSRGTTRSYRRAASPCTVAASLFCCLITALPASVAEAEPSDCGVLSGAAVTWLGTNTIAIGYGRVRIDGAGYIEIQGINFNTKAAGAIFDLLNGGPQAAYLAYYVYYAAAGAETLSTCNFNTCFSSVCVGHNCNVYVPVISRTPPLAEGYPSGAMSYVVSGQQYGPTQSAVFLGSYITDGNGDIVPFNRMGDEVTLMWRTGLTAFGFYGWAQAYWTHDSYVPTQSYNLGQDAFGHLFRVPRSARWGIADLLFSSNVASPAFDIMGVVHPDAPVNVGDTSWHPVFAEYANAATTPVAIVHRLVRVPLDSRGSIYLADPVQPAPGVTDWEQANYAGYVEVIHHL